MKKIGKIGRVNIAKLIISLILPFLAGFIGSWFTFPNIESWYMGLNKPFFNPPNWLFGPAWTTLYILMGASFFLVWKMGFGKKEVRLAVMIYLVQLALNSLWSIIFFGLQNLALAFMEITVLWIAILATIICFGKVDRNAALLLVPYILWVSFASVLNYFVMILN